MFECADSERMRLLYMQTLKKAAEGKTPMEHSPKQKNE